MTARILDGTAIAAKLRHRVAERVRERIGSGLRPPGLAVVLVGDDPASQIYVRLKHRDCLEVGIRSEVRELAVTTTEAALLAIVRTLNADPAIDGILVQLPLPAHVNASRVLEAILPDKDVDGVHPFNIGRLVLRDPVLRSCTPKGIMQLIDHTGIAIRGLDATVVGASNHVGRPMGLELLLAGCTVTTAHKFTERLEDHVRAADVLVAAAGRPGLVRGDWIKPGAIVIDVGITRGTGGKLEGDVDFPAAAERASWITPVPGGVGPMTRIAMLQNTLYAADHFHAAHAGG
jgi:methylenetetrahydrofolate dehydrogenase (NADP+)/methenyltetrahydrofolate cyclohydrolase